MTNTQHSGAGLCGPTTYDEADLQGPFEYNLVEYLMSMGLNIMADVDRMSLDFQVLIGVERTLKSCQYFSPFQLFSC